MRIATTRTEARVWECSPSYDGTSFRVKLYTGDSRLGILTVHSNEDLSGVDATEWYKVTIRGNRLLDIAR